MAPGAWARSAPEGDDGGEGDGGGLVLSELVVSCGDAAEVLEAVDGGFDAPALAIAAFVMLDAALAGARAGDDALAAQCGAQPVRVVAPVGRQATDAAGRLGQHRRSGGHVAAVAGGEEKDAGRPSTSTRAWSLVVWPPRDGPMACARAPLAALRRAVRFHVGRVDGGRLARPSGSNQPGLASAASIARQEPRPDQRSKRL